MSELVTDSAAVESSTQQVHLTPALQHSEGNHEGKNSTTPCILKTEEDSKLDDEPIVYTRRWFMLTIFCLVSMTNAVQWIQYASISNVVADYYDVSSLAVDWLSMIFMLLYIPLIFPVTWLLDKRGLKVIGLLGSSLNCLGGWLRFAGAKPSTFALAFVGQSVCSVAQVFILGMPAHVAATWFGGDQVSTACAIGVFGNQVGVALGFVLPPYLVPNDENVEKHMRNMFLGTAIITSVLFLLVVFFYQAEPPTPPSKARQKSHEAGKETTYMQSINTLLHNRNFVFLVITYGVNVGSFYAVSTLLNQIVLSEFPGEEQMVGLIGLAIVIAGLLGSAVMGYWLDRTRTYRGTTVVVYVLTLIGMGFFSFTLYLSEIWVVFGVASFLGFFMTGYLPLGFEFAAELTYPEPEGTSSGLLNAAAQTFGIVFTMSMGALVSNINALAGNLFLCIAILIGTIITAFIKSDLRRQRAENQQVCVQNSCQSNKLMHD
ncbi:feline leukemia virus subgroup C receptor-related protein 2-like isoform X2 [Anneissia japonica]|uniref:feline leukemia virus subgroup C receptor-related protein 2-like isoform X2 n=1 Tax=Anneissia japonica TaxID=1529436 RepID=UPI0014255B12|nr:feline leukemia virus subgroup C receptor-related protein 2-like isoform X2 [Anneissia japonica]